MSWVMNRSDMPSSSVRRRISADDVLLHDRVERAGRFVGDQQPGPAGDGSCDRHPLLLAAGKLVRVGFSQRRRIRQADAAEQFVG